MPQPLVGNTNHTHDRLAQALALHQRGALSDAEQIYQQILKQHPRNFDALRLAGVLALQTQRAQRGVELLEQAIKQNPNSAAAHRDLGTGMIALNRIDAALASYDKAIALQPNYAEAYYNRGDALCRLQRHESALSSYDTAIALQPNHADAHNNRGAALFDLRRYEAAVESCDKAIALRPDHAPAHTNRGAALYGLLRHDDALASYDKALTVRPDYAKAHWSKSLCLLQMGRLQQGWQEFEWRKKTDTPVANRAYTQPLWLGQQDIAGKTLFLYWEQGFGDTIQFCRYAKLAQALGAHVIMSVQDPLLRLIRQLEPAIRIIGGNQEPATFDYHCPLMSLPLAMRTTLETIPAQVPYLRADPERSTAWRRRLAALPGRKVGLVWAGAPRPEDPRSNTADRWRSITLDHYAPLASIAGLCLISLQKGDTAAQARTPPAGMVLHDWTNELDDFADTAALAEALDLIISVDTSVVHLAGALGKPVWVLNRYDQCWRWLTNRRDSPWYPTARLFRQRKPGDWDEVIEQVRRELCDV